MSFDGRIARAAAALAIVLGVWVAAVAHVTVIASPDPSNTETRALWVLRSSLATPQSIATLVKSAREHGFNTLLVQVRGRGDAYYLGGVEPRASELQRQPDNFDPLATVLDQGHAAGLKIHAWVNVNLVSSATELPSAREHLIYRACVAAGFEPRIAYVTRDPLAIGELVGAGLAVTLAPELLAGRLSGVAIVALEDEVPRRALYALTPASGVRPAAREFVTAVAEGIEAASATSKRI